MCYFNFDFWLITWLWVVHEEDWKKAKAIAIRNNLKSEDIKPNVWNKIRDVELTEEDVKIDTIEDEFGPVSTPKEEYSQLPSDVSVVFVGSQKDLGMHI